MHDRKPDIKYLLGYKALDKLAEEERIEDDLHGYR